MQQTCVAQGPCCQRLASKLGGFQGVGHFASLHPRVTWYSYAHAVHVNMAASNGAGALRSRYLGLVTCLAILLVGRTVNGKAVSLPRLISERMYAPCCADAAPLCFCWWLSRHDIMEIKRYFAHGVAANGETNQQQQRRTRTRACSAASSTGCIQ